MSFFREISERIGDYTLTLTIAKDKGQLVVMLVPKLETKKDEALKEIIPLTVKGTPDQLDAGFILAISQGIQMTTGLQTNIKEFEAGLKKAEKKVKGKDEKKSDSPPISKTNPNLAAEAEGSDDDENSNEDDLPFGDGNTVDTTTGEVIEPEPKKEPEPKAKSVEPKAKAPVETNNPIVPDHIKAHVAETNKAIKAKEEKEPAPAPTALAGEIVVTNEDEW